MKPRSARPSNKRWKSGKSTFEIYGEEGTENRRASGKQQLKGTSACSNEYYIPYSHIKTRKNTVMHAITIAVTTLVEF